MRVMVVMLVGLVSCGSTVHGREQPNILLITADNLGYGDLGCYGNDEVLTPNLDRLATQSVRSTDFYTASPTCTVSRATLLTGRYPQRIGLNHQLNKEENWGLGLRASEWLIPRYLKAAGYSTACFGKWNIGFAPRTRPTERGFDEFLGIASGNCDYYTHVYAGRHDLFRGTQPVHMPGRYSTDLFADEACQFIRKCTKPFFAYLPFNAPHFPNAKNKAPGVPVEWQAPPEAFAAYGWTKDEKDPKKRYYAVITALDSAIGRVLATLDELKLGENTLVVFYSDNGAFMLPGRGLEVASNGPLRDGGVTLFEGGIRVPCLVRWPGRLPAGTICSQHWISLDLLPMFLEAAGIQPPADRVLDGVDPTDLLAGTSPSPHDALYFQFRNYSAMRAGRYKIVRTKPTQPFMLFDLEADIGETTDLAGDKPELLTQMRECYEQWFASFGDMEE